MNAGGSFPISDPASDLAHADAHTHAPHSDTAAARAGSSSRDDQDGPRQFALPFAHLNLRFNPFGELDRSERVAAAVVDGVEGERWVAELADPRAAVQFLGEAGRGKTTHLLALAARFPRSAYVYVGPVEGRFVASCARQIGWEPRMARGSPLVVDEVQRLPRLVRRRLFRRAAPLLLGTHEDFAADLAAAGRRVTTVEVGGRLDAERLAGILNRRIELARRADGPLPRVRLATARRLVERFGSDVRRIEGHLYERFQTLTGIEDV